MERPAVSVIIPVLNTRPYLQECLDSVVGQSLKGIEIICVDNGSTDGSLELLQDYARKHANLFVLQAPRQGRLGGARNAGMKVARGEFIGFVDSDDYVAPCMFSDLYDSANKVDAELAICNTTYFYQKSGRTGTAVPDERLRCDGGFEITQRPKLLRNLTSWNKLYSAALLKRLDLWFPEGFYHEDHFFVVIALFLAKKIVTIPEAHYFYRKQREGSICMYRGEDNLHVFTVLKNVTEFLLKHNLDQPRACLLDELRISRILALCTSIRGRLRRSYFEKMQQEFRAIRVPEPQQILSPTECREYRVILKSGYYQYRIFQALRAIYGTLLARPALRNPALRLREALSGAKC